MRKRLESETLCIQVLRRNLMNSISRLSSNSEDIDVIDSELVTLKATLSQALKIKESRYLFSDTISRLLNTVNSVQLYKITLDSLIEKLDLFVDEIDSYIE